MTQCHLGFPAHCEEITGGHRGLRVHEVVLQLANTFFFSQNNKQQFGYLYYISVAFRWHFRIILKAHGAAFASQSAPPGKRRSGLHGTLNVAEQSAARQACSLVVCGMLCVRLVVIFCTSCDFRTKTGRTCVFFY